MKKHKLKITIESEINAVRLTLIDFKTGAVYADATLNYGIAQTIMPEIVRSFENLVQNIETLGDF